VSGYVAVETRQVLAPPVSLQCDREEMGKMDPSREHVYDEILVRLAEVKRKENIVSAIYGVLLTGAVLLAAFLAAVLLEQTFHLGVARARCSSGELQHLVVDYVPGVSYGHYAAFSIYLKMRILLLLPARLGGNSRTQRSPCQYSSALSRA